jgi:hypothetical protein
MNAASWVGLATFAASLTIGSIGATVELAASDGSALIQQGLSAFTVNEATAGDLNGDGDAIDAVVHVADRRSDVSLNLGLAASTVCRTTMVPPFVDCQPVEPVVARTVAAFLVDEAAQGSLDLNGDGDAQDAVLYVYDGQSRQLITTGLAVSNGVGRDVSSFTFPIAPVVTEKLVVFLVSEAESGGVDLNGDTDTVDAVFHLVDLKTAAMVNLAKAAATIPGPFGSRNPVPPSVNGQQVTLTVGESDQGGVDLNGDGDADDHVTFVLHRDELKAATTPPAVAVSNRTPTQRHRPTGFDRS